MASSEDDDETTGLKLGSRTAEVDGILGKATAPTGKPEGAAMEKERFCVSFGGNAGGGSLAEECRLEVPSNSEACLGLVPLLLNDKAEMESESPASLTTEAV